MSRDYSEPITVQYSGHVTRSRSIGGQYYLVARHADGVSRGGDDSDSGKVGDVIILRRAGDQGLQT